MKKLFKSLTFFKKMLFSYLSILIVSVAVMILFTNTFFIGSVKEALIQKNIDALGNLKNNVETVGNEIREIKDYITFNMNYESYYGLKNPNQILAMQKELVKYVNTNNYIEEIVLYLYDDAYMYSSKSSYTIPFFINTAYKYENWTEEKMREDLQTATVPYVRAAENDDGIMLYICRDTREYHFTTHGKGLEYFNKNGLKYIESKVVPYLTENDYYEAFDAYIETSEELLSMAKSGKPYNEKQYSTKYLISVIVICLVAPLLIAFWMMKKKLKKMKTAVENDYAANYIKSGSMRIDTSRDLFLYSRITKTERPKSSSGTHTSSSGRTHGGRGGSF